MKVLHILDHYLPLFSGYTFRTRNILIHQRKILKIEPVLVTSIRQEENFKEMIETFDAIKVHRIKFNIICKWNIPVFRELWDMFLLTLKIIKVVKLEKPDVLHAHSPVLNAWPAILAGKWCRLPVVYEIRAFWEDAAVSHGSTIEGSFRYNVTRAIETYACKTADAVVTICEGLRQSLRERGILQKKLFVLPNGVDVEQFLPPEKNAALCSKLNLDGKFVVGYIGSLYRYEGLRFLLQAMVPLVKNKREIACLIVGGGYSGEEEELKKMVVSLGIEKNVIIQGKVPHEQVASFYSIMDLLVYPREQSRLLDLVTPLKPLEALSMSRVVLGSDVGGIKELIKEGESGVLFKADDVSDLVSKIQNLADDSDLYAKLKQQARPYVKKHRDWGKLILTHGQVYQYLGLHI